MAKRDEAPWLGEGAVLDDAGNLIGTVHIDLRDVSTNAISALVKGCRRQHALEDGDTVLLSKPARFREFGEALIQDEQEGLAKEESVTVLHETPAEMARQQAVADRNEALEVVNSSMRIARTETRERRKTHTKSFSYGNDWWVYCTSIQPDTDEEWEAWRSTLPKDYDHVSEIGQPAKFAQALARMVTDQWGALAGDGWLQDTTSGYERLRTSHRQQLVIHGPVVYRDSVYQTLARMDDERARMAASIFTKDREYSDQREYRFAVFNGGSSEETVSLNISGMMRDALARTERGLVRSFSPAHRTAGRDADRPRPESMDGPTVIRKSRTVTERRAQREEQRSETRSPDGQVEFSESERRERIEERIVDEVEESESNGFLAGSCIDREDDTGDRDRPAQDSPQGPEPIEQQPGDDEVVRILASGEAEEHARHREEETAFRSGDDVFEWLGKTLEKKLEDPTAPMSPIAEPWREAACSPEEIARTFGSIDTMEVKIAKVAAKHRQDAASACWYATQCIRNIHARLGDIVDTLWIERGRFVVIRLKESESLQAKGHIAIAPRGSYAYCLWHPHSERVGHGEVEEDARFFPIGSVIETFEAFGWPAKTA